MKKLCQIILLLIAGLSVKQANAQIELCQNNTADPVFYDNFGEEVGYGDPLNQGATTYTYSSAFPQEGEYTIYNNTFPGLSSLPGPDDDLLWHVRGYDYTYEQVWYPNSVQQHPGGMLLINANEEEGIFYQKRIEGLCANTNYQFSLGVAALYDSTSQLCSTSGDSGAPVNFKIQIWNSSLTELIAEEESGDIPNTSSLVFNDYGVSFSLPSAMNIVVRVINNNSQAGCGNDLAIDEVKLQICGGEALISSDDFEGEALYVCSDDLPATVSFQLDYDGLDSDVYNWQTSSDGVTWEDLSGETNTTLTVSEIVETTYFRVKVASNLINIFDDSNTCFWVSNTLVVYAIDLNPPVSWGNRGYCEGMSIPPAVIVPIQGVNVNWYSAPTGGVLLAENTPSYTPDSPGTFYAEAYVEGSGCVNPNRTPVTIFMWPEVIVPPPPDPILICGGEPIILDAGVDDVLYEWSSNLGNTKTVEITEPGIYVVTVRTEGSDCATSRIFEVYGYTEPIIHEVIVQGTTVTIIPEGQDQYYYSLDGENWQESNTFYNVESGYLTAYLSDEIQCGVDTKDFLLVNPPKFITPNNDGINDYFTIEGLSKLNNVKVYIFDRFGKLLSTLSVQNPYWDGTLNGMPLPATDYWFRLDMDQKPILNGHFSLLH